MAPSNDELLAKINVLEAENNALSDKIEYSTLLNIIASSTDSSEDINEIVDSVLEKICILKQLPFAALFSMHNQEVKLENSYQLFDVNFKPLPGFRFPESILSNAREEGFLIVQQEDFTSYGLEFVHDYPEIRTLLFYHLSSKFFPDAMLLFVDSVADSNLPSMIYLFEQVISYLVEKLDKLYYWTELQKLNNELEKRVELRTTDLETVNRVLEEEIRERREFQKELLAKEKFIRSIYEAAKNVSFITVGLKSGELIINSFSPGSVKLYGYTAKEVIDKPLSTVISIGNIKKMNLFEQGPKTENLELEIVRITGEKLTVIHNSYPISNDSGEVVAELLVCIDITNLKQVQRQLIDAKNAAVKADSLKTIFLQNMSHEIRTPLNAIVGFSDLLNKPDLENENIAEFTGIIAQSSTQLLSLVNDILDISKIESGQYDIKNEVLNLRQMLDSLHAQYGPVANRKGLSLTLELPAREGDLMVESDAIKLQQVLINLIGNAIKFSDNGVIKISCYRDSNEIVIAVADRGIGIARENHNIVFERFRQVDLRSVRSYRGTGLGLYICKAYMNLLGGKIWVESELGTGSIFYLSLPELTSGRVSKDEIETPRTKTAIPSEIEVLVAEDEDTNYQLIEVYLKSMKIKNTRAFNGAEAVELVRNNRYDLILMDIQMPVLDGLEATKQIRIFNPDIPVIAITAFAFENERIQALDAGCNEHLSKPIKKEVLENSISKFVPAYKY